MNPLFQVIISLLILLLLGYFAYNIYILELEQLLKSTPGTKKEINIFKGILDLKTGEFAYETYNKGAENYLDITPSINQSGGAEYSYNFWVYTDKDYMNATDHDIILLLKGEKKLYYSNNNYNCSNKYQETGLSTKHYNVMIKNPLIKMSADGSAIVVEYNNINNVESYQQRSAYVNCDAVSANKFVDKNKNLIGVYQLDFDKKWYMVTIIMKEVDAGSILMKNKASCKIYINGINVMDKKVETKYNDTIYAATFRNNKSPLYINPDFTDYKYNPYGKVSTPDTLKLADMKYFNYAISEKEVSQLYSSGFSKGTVELPKVNALRYDQVSIPEMELKEIKEI